LAEDILELFVDDNDEDEDEDDKYTAHSANDALCLALQINILFGV
jgi:hypothetical protein